MTAEEEKLLRHTVVVLLLLTVTCTLAIVVMARVLRDVKDRVVVLERFVAREIQEMSK